MTGAITLLSTSAKSRFVSTFWSPVPLEQLRLGLLHFSKRFIFALALDIGFTGCNPLQRDLIIHSSPTSPIASLPSSPTVLIPNLTFALAGIPAWTLAQPNDIGFRPFVYYSTR